MPDEARDGRNVALIDKCFMVCSIFQRRIKLLGTGMLCTGMGTVDVHAHVKIHAWGKVNSISGQTDSVACGWRVLV